MRQYSDAEIWTLIRKALPFSEQASLILPPIKREGTAMNWRGVPLWIDRDLSVFELEAKGEGYMIGGTDFALLIETLLKREANT